MDGLVQVLLDIQQNSLHKDNPCAAFRVRSVRKSGKVLRIVIALETSHALVRIMWLNMRIFTEGLTYHAR